MLDFSDFNRNARVFWWALMMGGAGTLSYAIGMAAQQGWTEWQKLAALLALTLLAGLRQVRIPGTKAITTPSDALIFLSALYLGAPGATIIACADIFLATRRVTQRWSSRLAAPAVMALTVYPATELLYWAWRALEQKLASAGAALFLALQLFALVHFLLNSGMVAALSSLKRREPFFAVWRSNYAWYVVMNAANASAAGLIYLGIEKFGLVSLLAGVPIVAVVFAMCFYYLKQTEQAELHLRELEESEERFRSSFDYASTGMALLGPDEKWLQANHALCRLLGYSEEELLAGNLQSVSHPDDVEVTRRRLSQLLDGTSRSAHLEQRFVHREGHHIWGYVSAAAIRDAQRNVRHLILQVQDFTDRKRAEEQLRHDALHDALTGLPNRTLLLDHIKMALARAQRRAEQPFAILFLDFDRFKVINDSLGHLAGDQLLTGIARRLEVGLRPGDTIARLGGDEFVLLLEDLKPDEAVAIAERLQEELRQPFNLGGHEVFVSVSIGITFSAPHYQRPEEMLRDADTAMYYAKSQGRARHAIFDGNMHVRAMKLMQIETDLRFAVERQEFFLVYQPIISLMTGRLEGFEALVRWKHPQMGVVSPADFIPVAEDTGLIVPIGQWVLETVCRQLREWQALPEADQLTMSVNLSGRQLMQPDVVERVKQALTETGADPLQIKLEITESVLMENLNSLTATLHRFREMGIQLSIDDFGTGYSSLSYLHRLPVQTIKIDRSFVKQMLENQENAEIVRTILTLAKTLGMTAVAEGIEEQEHAEYLCALECESAQGYFFAKPMAPEAAEQMVRDQHRWQILRIPSQPLPHVVSEHLM